MVSSDRANTEPSRLSRGCKYFGWLGKILFGLLLLGTIIVLKFWEPRSSAATYEHGLNHDDESILIPTDYLSAFDPPSPCKPKWLYTPPDGKCAPTHYLPSTGYSDVFTNSCANLQTFINTCGAVDAYGSRHAGYDGWTVFCPTYTVEKEETSKEFSSPNDTYCVTKVARVHLEANNESRWIIWEPADTACDYCLCKLASDKWNQDVKERENRHSKELQGVKNQWNANHSEVRYTYCGHVLSEVMANAAIGLAYKEQALLENFRSALGLELQEDYDALGKVTPLYCDNCSGCQTGQTPKTCGIIGCNKCENGTCVYNPPKDPKEICCKNKYCGLNSTGEAIGCCNVNGEIGCCPQ
jgi:hypothetical protein